MICPCGLPIHAGPDKRAVAYVQPELYGIMLDCDCGSSHVAPIWMSEELALDLAEFYWLEVQRELAGIAELLDDEAPAHSSDRDSRRPELEGAA